MSGDYDTRHEQAPGTSSLLKIQEALNNKTSGANLAPNGRKISVEQLFQVKSEMFSEILSHFYLASSSNSDLKYFL